MNNDVTDKKKKKKIFTKSFFKTTGVIVLVLVLAALIAGGVYGYQMLQSVDKKVSELDARFEKALPEQDQEEIVEDVPEDQPPVLEYELTEKKTVTKSFLTAYDQTTGEPIYEPTDLLELTVKVTNYTGTLYDGSSRFFVATRDGALVSDSGYSISDLDKAGPSSVTLAPNGVGSVVLYFEIDDRSFSSLYIDDISGTSTSIDL